MLYIIWNQIFIIIKIFSGFNIYLIYLIYKLYHTLYFM